MIVYIEYAILDNMTMDSIILYAVGATIGSRRRWCKILLGAVVGTAGALLVPLLNIWVQYLVKAISLVAMCGVANGRHRLEWHIVLTVVYTFALGGILIGALSLLGVQYSIDNTQCTYSSNIPWSIYVIGVLLGIAMCRMVVAYIKDKRSIHQYVVDVSVSIGAEIVPCSGYIDSGNRLKVGGVPVCFACGKVAQIVRQQLAVALLLGSAVDVRYDTLAGTKTTLAVPASIAIANRYCDVLIVASHASMHGCQILLNHYIVEE